MSAVTAGLERMERQGSCLPARQDEGTGLGLQLAGNASLSGVPVRLYLNFLKEFGYYWTATEEENNGLQETTVFYRKIFGSRTTVYRDAAPLNILMRVRCVRDALKGLKTSNKKWRMTEKDFSISHKNRNDRIVIQNHHL